MQAFNVLNGCAGWRASPIGTNAGVGEPDAPKGACPVRKGVVGNVTGRPNLLG
jgi:hypothetical protein